MRQESPGFSRGEEVKCINFDTYKGGGGLSCDWDNASGKDVETK